MREGPVPTKALSRWLLRIIRKIRLNSPLAKRSATYCPPPTVTSPMSRVELARLTPAATLAHIESLAADEAWAAYRLLTPEMQEMVAAHVNTDLWSQLLVREIRDQAVECFKREDAGVPEPTSSGPTDYFAFKSTAVRCQVCAWSGRGDLCSSRAIAGESEWKSLLRICPSCSSTVALTTWPTVAEFLAAWATLTEHERLVVFNWERGHEDRESEAHP
jgi:hypothetical protein